MSGSVARSVARAGTAILAATLLAVGVATGAALYAQDVRAVDQALLAAAHAWGRPADGAWQVEHSRAPVDVWEVGDGDRRVPDELIAAARRSERPAWGTTGDRRVVVVVAEDDADRHALVAASAPAATMGGSVGPFALAYTALALLAVGVAHLAQVVAVRHAFAPLEAARSDAERVVALGQGQRLRDDAPEEIRGLLHAMNGLLGRLDAAYAAQGRFTAEAAHELRTPVTAMLGELDVALRRERSEAEYRSILASTREEAARLSSLVQALTALARLDAGHADTDREPARAGELVDHAIRAEKAGLDAAGCALTLRVEADPEVIVHRGLVELALANLLRNAARHAPGQPVEVTVAAGGGELRVVVDDGGPGIAPDEREAMFDRFARSGRSRRYDAAGLGLGLPLAREIARRHGGDCRIATSERGGARVQLTLALPPGQATAREI